MESPNLMEGGHSDIGAKQLQETKLESHSEVLGRKGIILGKITFALLLLGLFLLLKNTPGVGFPNLGKRHQSRYFLHE